MNTKRILSILILFALLIATTSVAFASEDVDDDSDVDVSDDLDNLDEDDSDDDWEDQDDEDLEDDSDDDWEDQDDEDLEDLDEDDNSSDWDLNSSDEYYDEFYSNASGYHWDIEKNGNKSYLVYKTTAYTKGHNNDSASFDYESFNDSDSTDEENAEIEYLEFYNSFFSPIAGAFDVNLQQRVSVSKSIENFIKESQIDKNTSAETINNNSSPDFVYSNEYGLLGLLVILILSIVMII